MRAESPIIKQVRKLGIDITRKVIIRLIYDYDNNEMNIVDRMLLISHGKDEGFYKFIQSKFLPGMKYKSVDSFYNNKPMTTFELLDRELSEAISLNNRRLILKYNKLISNYLKEINQAQTE